MGFQCRKRIKIGRRSGLNVPQPSAKCQHCFADSAEKNSNPSQGTDGAKDDPCNCKTSALVRMWIGINRLDRSNTEVDGNDAEDESEAENGKHPIGKRLRSSWMIQEVSVRGVRHLARL